MNEDLRLKILIFLMFNILKHFDTFAFYKALVEEELTHRILFQL